MAEFAPAVLAARLQLSAYAGARLVADVLDLQHRLPHLWAGVQALQVDEQHARFVARKTRLLSPEEAADVDERVAEAADGRLSWTRFETLVEAAIVAADPAAAEAREHASAREAFARTTHSTEHGMRGFYVRADFATIARIDATVAFLADSLLALGDDSPLDRRRVKAVLILANPTQAVKILAAFGRLRDQTLADNEPSPEPTSFDPARATDPTDPDELRDLLDERSLLTAVWLFVHLTGRDATTGSVARVEGGCDPVTAQWVRDHLGPRCAFKITPVLDPLNQTPVDAYEIPARHQQAVHLLTPADTFPFASSTRRDQQQTDHTIPWSPARAAAGEKLTRIGNYGPMTTFHHRLKTHGDWQVRQAFPGLYLWRDPHGATYLVDHTGTRRIPHPTAAATRLQVRWADLPRLAS